MLEKLELVHLSLGCLATSDVLRPQVFMIPEHVCMCVHAPYVCMPDVLRPQVFMTGMCACMYTCSTLCMHACLECMCTHVAHTRVCCVHNVYACIHGASAHSTVYIHNVYVHTCSTHMYDTHSIYACPVHVPHMPCVCMHEVCMMCTYISVVCTCAICM